MQEKGRLLAQNARLRREERILWLHSKMNLIAASLPRSTGHNRNAPYSSMLPKEQAIHACIDTARSHPLC